MKSLLPVPWLLFAGIFLQPPVSAAEPEWGDLRMRFVVDGKPPKLQPLPVTKDREVCGKEIPSERFVVDKDGGIQNFVVWLLLDKGGKLAIHPDYDKPEVKNREVVVVMKECRFQPHVVAIRVGQAL